MCGWTETQAVSVLVHTPVDIYPEFCACVVHGEPVKVQIDGVGFEPDGETLEYVIWLVVNPKLN
jgi:hypothetical protein